MAERDALLDDVDALIGKLDRGSSPVAATPRADDDDPVLREVDEILAPYEVHRSEREATSSALEVGKWPGDETIRPAIEKGGRKAFNEARDARIPTMRQLTKARSAEAALKAQDAEHDSFTNRATEFAKSLFAPSEAPAPIAQTPPTQAPLPVPAAPRLSPSPLHTTPMSPERLVSDVSKADKSAAGNVLLAYKRHEIEIDQAYQQLREIYGRYTNPDDLDRPVNGLSLRDALAQTKRRPANPEAINSAELPPILQMVDRYKSANPLERGPKVGPDKLHPFERAGAAPDEAPADDYDYEAARAAGVTPQVDPHETEIDPKTGKPYLHWPSQFKKDHHPHRFLPTELGVYDSKNNRLVPPDEFERVATPEQFETVQTEKPLPASEVQGYLGNADSDVDMTLPEVTVRPGDNEGGQPDWLTPQQPIAAVPGMPLQFTDRQGNPVRNDRQPSFASDKTLPLYDDAREVGRQIVAGLVVDLPKMTGQAMQALSADETVANRAGKAMAAAAKLREEGWKPDMAGRGSIADAFIRGGRSIAPSLATVAAYLNPYGAVLGPLSTIALYGGSQFQEEYDKVKAAGGTDEDARSAGIITGAIQGGGEVLANQLTLGMFGATKTAAKAGIKRLLGDTVDGSVIKPWLKATGAALIGEPATEVAQDVGTAITEQRYGLTTEPLAKTAYDSATAAGAMTFMLSPIGLAGHYQNAQRAKAINRILRDPQSAPQEERAAVVRMLHDEAMQLKIPNAEAWLSGALEDVRARQPIRRDAPTDTGAADVPAATEPLAQGPPASAPATVSAPPPIEGVRAEALADLPEELQITGRAPYLIKGVRTAGDRPTGQSGATAGPPSPEVRRFDELLERYTLPTARDIAERKTGGPRSTPMPWETVPRPDEEMPSQRQIANRALEEQETRERVDATQNLPRPGVEIPILKRPDPVKKQKAARIEIVAQPTPRERIRFEDLSPEDRESLAYVTDGDQSTVQTPAPVERPAAVEKPTPIERPKPVIKPGDAITPEMREALDAANEDEIQEQPAAAEKPVVKNPTPTQQIDNNVNSEIPPVEASQPVEKPEVAPDSRAEVAPTAEAAPLPINPQVNNPEAESLQSAPVPVATAPTNERPGQNPARKKSTASAQRFANLEGHNDAANELRSLAHDNERPGDVMLDNQRFVSVDDAVRIASEGIESGLMRPYPFQLNNLLGLAMRDASRVAELATPASAEAKPQAALPVASTSIDAEAQEAATSPQNDLPQPTDGQKEAGNYKKGHVSIAGLDISIENPEGSVRSGKSPSGKPWQTTLKSHYGYIRGTVGKDKDHLDVFVKPGTPEDYNGPVYVIDQKNPGTDRFDEHKIIIGGASLTEAKKLYHENYTKGWKGMQAATRFTMPEFKQWLKTGDHTKPAMNQVPTLAPEDPAPSLPAARQPAALPVPAKRVSGEASQPTVKQKGQFAKSVKLSTSDISTIADTQQGGGPSAQTPAPWEMTHAEWENAYTNARPEIRQGNYTRRSGSEATRKFQEAERLRYGVHAAASQRLADAAQGKITLTPTEVEALQEQIDTPVTHRLVVKKALDEGRPVPARVLADYPDLRPVKKTDPSVIKAQPKSRRRVGAKREAVAGDQGSPIRDLEEADETSEPPSDRRTRGVPAAADPPISSFRSNDAVKAHPDYRAAKGGDGAAAIRLVQDLVKPETLDEAAQRFTDSIFVAPLAQEASGLNAIPKALAAHYANAAGGQTDSRIMQANKVFHTGADAMQRLIARPQFTGEVTRGGRYVLVDDVTTMGGTFAELAHHIQRGGGEVVGVVALTNAARNEKLSPSPARIRLLQERFGDAITDVFGIDPVALTAPEAGYLSNFRDADDLRARAAAAEKQRARRLVAKGLSQREDPDVTGQPGPTQTSSDSQSTPTDFGSPQRDTTESTRSVSAPRRERLSLKHLTDLERQGQAVADAFLEAVDQAAKRPLPTRPRIPVSPILGGPSKTLSNIVIDVQKGTGKKLTTGKPGRGFAGVYKPGSSTTIVRYSGDLDTTAHELAHALDDEYGILKAYAGQPTSPFDAELKPFGEHGSITTTGPRSSPTYWRAEGVAEWTRAWIVNPQAAEAAAPTFTQHFKQAVPANILKALESFSTDIRQHAGHSAHAKIMANVEWETPESPLLAWMTGPRTAPGPGFQLTFGDQLATELTDRLAPFMKALKYAQDQRQAPAPLPGKDPALLARLYMGANAKIDDVFEHGMIDARLQRATPGGLKWLLESLDPTALETEMQEVASLMIAQRTMEKARQLERDRVSGIGAGIESDVSVARARLAELKQDAAKYARLQEAASRYRQWADANLKYLVEKGRLSAEQYQSIKDNNEFYVAMQRLIEVSPGEELVVNLPRGTAGKKLGTVGQPVKSFKGSTRAIKNPYYSLMDATNQAIREADRNEVLSLFRDLLTQDRAMHAGQVADLASVGRKAETGEKHTIAIYKNGEKEIWQFHPDIYAALKGIEEGAYKFPWVLTILPRILRATIVNAPPFALRNLIRDAWQRTIVSRVGSKPWDVLKPYSQDEITQFQRSGGDQAGHYYTDPKSYGRALQFAMKELSKTKKSILVDPARLGRGYLELMQASERQGRMAEYRRAFEHAKTEFGYDDYHASLWAAGQARELLDFAVAGNWTQLVNQLVPFTNAAVQGLRRNIKGARENPAGVALRFGIYALVPSLLNFAWNALHGDGDDLEEYRNLPAYQRDLFYNYKLGPDNWLSIPKAFEVGVLATTFERAMDYSLGNQKAFEGHIGAFLRTLLPIDEAAFGGPFQGIFQAVANYDFFRDRPIVPRYEENLALDLRNTHRGSRLGQAIQSAIGVDSRKIDFVVEQQFGYFGRYATKASDIGREEKRGFGLDTVGLFRGSPATAALDVQKIKEIATERGVVASRGKNVDRYHTVSVVPAHPTESVKNPDAVRFGVFRRVLDAYYEAKGPAEKDAAAKTLRIEAASLRAMWEKTPPRPQAEEKVEITRKRDRGEISKDEATKAFKEMLKPKARSTAPFPLEPAMSP